MLNKLYIAAWWVKYLLPQDFGASQLIGIEQQKKYIRIAEKRILEG